MSLASQIDSLADAIAQKIKAVQVHHIVYSVPGDLSQSTGVIKFVALRTCVITVVRAVVGTAPTTQSIIVDVHKNGTTIFTTQANRPTIAAGATASGAATPNVTSLAAGDVLTVDIDQVGSGTTGANLSVSIGMY